MSSTTRWVLVLTLIACAGAGYYVWSQRATPQLPPAVNAPAPPPPAAVSDSQEPLTRHPLPVTPPEDTATTSPLPSLEDSDVAVAQALNDLVKPRSLDDLFKFDNFIERVVVTVDNLPRTKLPVQRLPSSPPPGKFLVKPSGNNTFTIDPANYKRYDIFIALVEAMDSKRLAALYFHFYPLFQDAYRDLGYKNAYFNDRVIEVIDDLLATPVVQDPVWLVQPSVYYKYADPKLEGLSAGQRLMIRMGSANAAKLKSKLLEMRALLTTGPVKSSTPAD